MFKLFKNAFIFDTKIHSFMYYKTARLTGELISLRGFAVGAAGGEAGPHSKRFGLRWTPRGRSHAAHPTAAWY